MTISTVNVKLRYVFVPLLALMMLAGFNSTTEAAPTDGFYHTVQYGETLSGIAYAYGVTADDILAYNPHVYYADWIYAGTLLYIPDYGYYGGGYHGGDAYCQAYHWVSYGETLSSIAYWYGVSEYAIANANGIYNVHYIYAHTQLCIPYLYY